jgi:hypothetical protein
VSDTDVRAAEKEAETAAQQLAALEHAVLHEPPDRRPGAAEVVEQTHLAAFAVRRVEVVRERAHRASAQQRLSDLAEVGAKIDDLAAEAEGPAAAIRAAQLQALAATAEDFRASCAAHDQTIRALARWADSLKLINIVGGHGPHADNAHVQVLGPPPFGGIAHDHTDVLSISHQADRALDAALSGQVDAALALVASVKHRPVPRAEHYFEVIRTGKIIVTPGEPDHGTTLLILDGQLRPLTEAEIVQHLETTR